MFDQEISFDRGDSRAHALATTRETAMACAACGSMNPTRYRFCVQCGSRTDAVPSSDEPTHPTSAAELVWDGLARDEVTAVWSSTVAGWPLAGQEDTIVLALRDAANENPSTVVDAAPTCDTELAAEPDAALVLRLAGGGYPGEGTTVAVHLIVREGWVDVGSECDGPWRDDAYLDAWHVRFTSAPGGVCVRDDGSRGGVWLRLDGGRWLLDGDRFRLGTEFLRYDAAESSACETMLRAGDRGRVQLVVEDEPVGPALPITGEVVLGREAADATFPHDPYVSAHHCRLVAVEDGVWLEDLGSSNGTWVRVRSGETIPFGSVIAMGSALYRIESGEP
jgi:hypothetical protein